GGPMFERLLLKSAATDGCPFDFRNQGRSQNLWLAAVLLLHLRTHRLGGLGGQFGLALGGAGHPALRLGQLLGLGRLCLGLLGGLRIGFALLLQALALQLAARGLGFALTVFQLDLVVLAIELGQLHLGVLQLGGSPGQVHLPLGDVERVRPLLRVGLRQLADRVARQRLFGLGVVAQHWVAGELVDVAGQPADVDVVAARLGGADDAQCQRDGRKYSTDALHGWPPTGWKPCVAFEPWAPDDDGCAGTLWKPCPDGGADKTEAEGAGMSSSGAAGGNAPAPAGAGAEPAVAGIGNGLANSAAAAAAACAPCSRNSAFAFILDWIFARAAPRLALTRARSASARDSAARSAACAYLRAAIAPCACWNLSWAKPRSTGS